MSQKVYGMGVINPYFILHMIYELLDVRLRIISGSSETSNISNCIALLTFSFEKNYFTPHI